MLGLGVGAFIMFAAALPMVRRLRHLIDTWHPPGPCQDHRAALHAELDRLRDQRRAHWYSTAN